MVLCSMHRHHLGGKMYELSCMDVHISVGTWLNHTAKCDRFNQMLDRCSKCVAEVDMLDFEIALDVCCGNHLVFRFCVASHRGKVLHALSQHLNKCSIHQLVQPPRGMSPPGQVFLLSVYGNTFLMCTAPGRTQSLSRIAAG